MIRCLRGMMIIAIVAITSPGCGESTNPEPKTPGASRDFMEHPLDSKEGAAAPKAPATAKTKAALENAKKADPRGH